ncbi:unnamed protein product [Caenorhabditis angaria]|uniref:C2H2-type domain-containing protein n=1 Tax=Caenorhabditis angaria TaxID=860376 RepID=A0A9P1IA40_9PELO|nr:unnamed protein product [Caenorhabditis angaria]
MQQKYVVVEIGNTPSTMSLVEYLVTHGFDKFAVVTDLTDHPSLKHMKDSASDSQHTPPRTAMSTPISMNTPIPPNNKPRASIDSIANALSKKCSPTSSSTSSTPTLPFSTPQLNHLSKLLEEQCMAKKEQDRQQAEIQRIILSQTNLPFGMDRLTPEFNDQHSETISKASSEDLKPELDFGLGPSDEQVRASMIHLLNPALGLPFGFKMFDENLFAAAAAAAANASGSGAGNKRKNADGHTPATKKHRWLPNEELEESRSSRGKNCGRVHCKATYKCALCGKPTTLNSTGSRWNLLRHVIMIHSDCKPYKCWDCDFTGIKSNVISHARQCRHRADDAHDVTTDEMRAEWNLLLHECFPDYVRAKERGWQPEPVVEQPKIEEVPIQLESTPTMVPNVNVKIEC